MCTIRNTDISNVTCDDNGAYSKQTNAKNHCHIHFHESGTKFTANVLPADEPGNFQGFTFCLAPKQCSVDAFVPHSWNGWTLAPSVTIHRNLVRHDICCLVDVIQNVRPWQLH